MKRFISATLAAAGLVLTSLALAQPAQAITNPADNPRPITVKGDDGKTYTDGEDTLPGYDDEACTYIPGASFDFENNKVRYADGQSITWTEWDRATGYKEWKAKQGQAAPAPAKTTAPKPVKTTAPAPKPVATKKPVATAKPSPKPAATKPTTAATTAAPTDDAVDPTDETAADAAATPGPEDTTDAPAADAAEPASADESAEAQDETTDVEVTRAASEEDSSGTGSAGLVILGGLAGAGLLAVAGYAAVARKRKGSLS